MSELKIDSLGYLKADVSTIINSVKRGSKSNYLSRLFYAADGYVYFVNADNRDLREIAVLVNVDEYTTVKHIINGLREITYSLSSNFKKRQNKSSCNHIDKVEKYLQSLDDDIIEITRLFLYGNNAGMAGGYRRKKYLEKIEPYINTFMNLVDWTGIKENRFKK
jgi:hypothetical protein